MLTLLCQPLLTLLTLLCQASTVSTFVDSFSEYDRELPNGNIINGSGRISHNGGSRHKFGKMSQSQRKRWSKALCEADSDGDNLRTATSLVTPGCIFPSRTANLTFPGSKSSICNNLAHFCSVRCRLLLVILGHDVQLNMHTLRWHWTTTMVNNITAN